MDACAEVLAAVEGGAAHDLVGRCKGGPDLADQLGVDARVLRDVEEKPAQVDGGGVGACDDEQVGFGQELWLRIGGSAGFGIFGLEEIVEHVFADGLAFGFERFAFDLLVPALGDAVREKLEVAFYVGWRESLEQPVDATWFGPYQKIYQW